MTCIGVGSDPCVNFPNFIPIVVMTGGAGDCQALMKKLLFLFLPILLNTSIDGCYCLT